MLTILQNAMGNGKASEQHEMQRTTAAQEGGRREEEKSRQALPRGG